MAAPPDASGTPKPAQPPPSGTAAFRQWALQLQQREQQEALRAVAAMGHGQLLPPGAYAGSAAAAAEDPSALLLMQERIAQARAQNHAEVLAQAQLRVSAERQRQAQFNGLGAPTLNLAHPAAAAAAAVSRPLTSIAYHQARMRLMRAEAEATRRWTNIEAQLLASQLAMPTPAAAAGALRLPQQPALNAAQEVQLEIAAARHWQQARERELQSHREEADVETEKVEKQAEVIDLADDDSSSDEYEVKQGGKAVPKTNRKRTPADVSKEGRNKRAKKVAEGKDKPAGGDSETHPVESRAQKTAIGGKEACGEEKKGKQGKKKEQGMTTTKKAKKVNKEKESRKKRAKEAADAEANKQRQMEKEEYGRKAVGMTANEAKLANRFVQEPMKFAICKDTVSQKKAKMVEAKQPTGAANNASVSTRELTKPPTGKTPQKRSDASSAVPRDGVLRSKSDSVSNLSSTGKDDKDKGQKEEAISGEEKTRIEKRLRELNSILSAKAKVAGTESDEVKEVALNELYEMRRRIRLLAERKGRKEAEKRTKDAMAAVTDAKKLTVAGMIGKSCSGQGIKETQGVAKGQETMSVDEKRKGAEDESCKIPGGKLPDAPKEKKSFVLDTNKATGYQENETAGREMTASKSPKERIGKVMSTANGSAVQSEKEMPSERIKVVMPSIVNKEGRLATPPSSALRAGARAGAGGGASTATSHARRHSAFGGKSSIRATNDQGTVSASVLAAAESERSPEVESKKGASSHTAAEAFVPPQISAMAPQKTGHIRVSPVATAKAKVQLPSRLAQSGEMNLPPKIQTRESDASAEIETRKATKVGVNPPSVAGFTAESTNECDDKEEMMQSIEKVKIRLEILDEALANIKERGCTVTSITNSGEFESLLLKSTNTDVLENINDRLRSFTDEVQSGYKKEFEDLKVFYDNEEEKHSNQKKTFSQLKGRNSKRLEAMCVDKIILARKVEDSIDQAADRQVNTFLEEIERRSLVARGALSRKVIEHVRASWHEDDKDLVATEMEEQFQNERRSQREFHHTQIEEMRSRIRWYDRFEELVDRWHNYPRDWVKQAPPSDVVALRMTDSLLMDLKTLENNIDELRRIKSSVRCAGEKQEDSEGDTKRCQPIPSNA